MGGRLDDFMNAYLRHKRKEEAEQEAAKAGDRKV